MIGQINIGNKNNRNINKILGVRRSLTATTSEWERIEDSIIKKQIFVIKVLRYVAIILSLLLAIIIVIKNRHQL